ncbi:MAG TPA: NadS family protein [Scandinavium sp.]|jgi:putative transcriptional regulator|uniref:NadS family protein n=1 Tax=Scandinavium sp. TaxID=2830653 RepID=UPI002E363517|nr:NadS family protein [Scandinavium sp.]HEX4502670.1 NadS family protein [Scandinavium sp.]
MDDNLFDDLLASAQEMVAIEKGEVQPHPDNVHCHVIPDVKMMRANFGMKQNEFAEAIGTSPALIQSWELKRRIPTGVALKMLRLLEQDPQLMNKLKRT